MKSGINLENSIKKIVEKLKADFLGYGGFVDINIIIPNGLFYYAEALNNGNGDQLEGEIISVELFGNDPRDTRYMEILIKESFNLPNIYYKTSFDRGICHLELNYQLARKLVLFVISDFSPHSVNLSTK